MGLPRLLRGLDLLLPGLGRIVYFLMSPGRPLAFDLIAGLGLLVFSFAFTWSAGNRGIYLLDYSIVFDGAWKVLQGQVPYRDFAVSHAPIAYYLLAGAFHWFGASYFTFLGFAGALNVVGVLASIRIARRLAPGTELLVGLVTSVWYMPIMGFPQIEHIAFCFDFVALWLVVEAGFSIAWIAWLARMLAGSLLLAALMTKQNAGLFFSPVLMLYVALLPFPKMKSRLASLLAILLGVLLALIPFVLWLWTSSDPSLFKHHVLDVPSQFGWQRLAAALSPQKLIPVLILGICSRYSIQLLTSLSHLVLGLMTLKVLYGKSPLAKGVYSPLWLLFGLMFFHLLFTSSMLNEVESGLPFIGLVAGLSLGLLRENLAGLDLHWPDRQESLAISSTHPFVCLPFLMMMLLLVYQGSKVSWQRVANEFPLDTGFTEKLNIPEASSLRWGNPTFLGGSEGKFYAPVTKAEFEGLYWYLRKTGKNFFVFPSSTILYGLLQKPSPAPWLFFLEGHSHAASDLPRLDTTALASFQKTNVCVWVKENASYMNEHENYSKLPKTAAWLTSNFRKTQQFGPYDVLENTNCK